MPPTLTWLDYSSTEREKMMDVISLFDEKGTTDELGIGSIRDAFAGMLFPGTSTIQTRARYFLFIPWTYRGLEKRKVPSTQVAREARGAEVRLIDCLAESGEKEGNIGIDARAALKRLPSAIYWSGLARLGILRFTGGQDQYHRALDSLYASKRRIVKDDDGFPVDGGALEYWDPCLPPVPKDFPSGTTFALSLNEAVYLRDRILTSAAGTMFAHLVQRGHHWEPTEFPWEYPGQSDLPTRVRTILSHCRNFSETMHGAYLLYNFMLAREFPKEDLMKSYASALELWAQDLTERAGPLAGWDMTEFWNLCSESGPIPVPTRRFVDSWLSLILHHGKAPRLTTDTEATGLIRDREIALKGALARLTNRRALELWNDAAGTARLSYRWRVAQRISRDIITGLSGGE